MNYTLPEIVVCGRTLKLSTKKKKENKKTFKFYILFFLLKCLEIIK